MKMILTGLIAWAILDSGSAIAADIPVKAPISPAPPIFNWGGVYLGLNGGSGFGTSNFSSTTCNPVTCTSGNFRTSGLLVGGTIGTNFQTNGFVFGAEADLGYSTLKGNSAPICGANATITCQTSSTWLGTARARVGFVQGRVLIFGTGGAAFGNVQATEPAFSSTIDNANKLGWTGGGGVEFAIAHNWTAKVEYLYVDLGNGFCGIACGTNHDPVFVRFTENLLRFGLNYKISR